MLFLIFPIYRNPTLFLCPHQYLVQTILCPAQEKIWKERHSARLNLPKVSYLVSSESGKLRRGKQKVLIYQFPFATSLFGLIPGPGFVWCFIWGSFPGGQGCVTAVIKRLKLKWLKWTWELDEEILNHVRQLETDAFITPIHHAYFASSHRAEVGRPTILVSLILNTANGMSYKCLHSQAIKCIPQMFAKLKVKSYTQEQD